MADFIVADGTPSRNQSRPYKVLVRFASSETVEQPNVYAIILDGAAVVQMLQPTAKSTSTLW